MTKSHIVPIENLILIPTAFESSLIQSQIDLLVADNSAVFHHCGFGPIAAAAIALEKIITDRPQRVYLLGIAGAYTADGQTSPALNVGQAVRFSSVRVDGIGVGETTSFQSPSDLGWPQFSGDDTREMIGDTINLNSDSPHGLLTVCAASANNEQATRRQQRYGAVAEDMEGFAVAMACQLQNIPLQIIRGISNVAGDREKSNWRIEEAMQAASKELQVALEEVA